MRIGVAEPVAVATLEVQAVATSGVDPIQVRRVDRQPVLVLFARGRYDTDG
ncbi:hypothetical protein [Nocardia sp. CA-135398]|uniref:hypothetical protein n=1 Tax=Nocardia sp. CA-135398 TaxID=3239977 RepID=UPI003D95DCC4